MSQGMKGDVGMNGDRGQNGDIGSMGDIGDPVGHNCTPFNTSLSHYPKCQCQSVHLGIRCVTL